MTVRPPGAPDPGTRCIYRALAPRTPRQSRLPRRVTGDTIPIEVAIVSVADAWDAVTATRHYCSAMSRDQAAEIRNAGAGSQWNPAAVALVLGCLSITERTERDHGGDVASRPPSCSVCDDALRPSAH